MWQLAINGPVHGGPTVVSLTVDVGTMFDEEFYNFWQLSVNGKVYGSPTILCPTVDVRHHV